MSSNLIVIRLRHGPFWNQSYIVGVPGGAAIVIDPAWDVPGILAAAKAHNLCVTHAIVTHAHHDHTHGLAELVAGTGAEVLAHEQDVDLLRREFAGDMMPVADGHELRAGPTIAAVLHTPGHTLGSICIAIGENLFTGDTLMVGALGRHGAYEGAREQLSNSVYEVIGRLAHETIVYPGHDEGPKPVAPLGEAMPRHGAK